MARYKPIPSQKQEFDAFWDDLMKDLGVPPQVSQYLSDQTKDLQTASDDFNKRCIDEANKGRAPSQPLEEFQKQKLCSLNIIADTLMSLEE